MDVHQKKLKIINTTSPENWKQNPSREGIIRRLPKIQRLIDYYNTSIVSLQCEDQDKSKSKPKKKIKVKKLNKI